MAVVQPALAADAFALFADERSDARVAAPDWLDDTAAEWLCAPDGGASQTLRDAPALKQLSEKGQATTAPSDKGAADERGVRVSFDAALVSDYRRGGISRSGNAAALQGGVDVSAPGGWNVGAWASTIKERKGAHAEVDLYAAKSFDLGETELTLGATAVIFPNGENLDFGLAQASVSRPIGPVDATWSVNYAWEQDNLDGEDHFNTSLRARTPVGRLFGMPLTAGASIGYSEGHFAIETSKLDWSLSLVARVHGANVGVSYIDTNVADERGDPACVVSIARRF